MLAEQCKPRITSEHAQTKTMANSFVFILPLMCNKLKEWEHCTMAKCCTGLKDHNKETYTVICMYS